MLSEEWRMKIYLLVFEIGLFSNYYLSCYHITSHHITSYHITLFFTLYLFCLLLQFWFQPYPSPPVSLYFSFNLLSLSPSTYSSSNSLLSSILLSIALISPSHYSYFYPYLSSSLNSFLHSFLSHLSSLSSPHFFLRLLLSLSLSLPTVLFFRLAEGGCTYARTKSVQRLHRQVWHKKSLLLSYVSFHI